MFDTARIGDTVLHCQQTFGLRPPEAWGEPTQVIDVQTDYYGQRVTVEGGTVLTSGLHHMSVVKRES